MNDNKNRTLELMKNLPEEMIEEYEFGNFLPYKKQTIKTMLNFFKRKLGSTISCETLGYTKEILDEIDSFYNTLEKNHVI